MALITFASRRMAPVSVITWLDYTAVANRINAMLIRLLGRSYNDNLDGSTGGSIV